MRLVVEARPEHDTEGAAIDHVGAHKLGLRLHPPHLSEASTQ